MHDTGSPPGPAGRLARRSRVMERSPLAVVLVEVGRVVDLNPAFARLVGRDAEDLLGVDVESLIAPQDRHLLLMEAAARELGREQGVLTCRLQSTDGLERWTRSSWFLERSPEGRTSVTTFVQDVEGKARNALVADEMLAAVEAERAVLNAALEASPDGLALFQAVRDEHGRTTDTRLLRMNSAGADGRSAEALVGRPLSDYFPESVPTGLHGAAVECLERQEIRRLVVEVGPDGTWPGVFDTVLVPIDPDRVLCSFRDVTGARAAEQQLLHAATHDTLTGLPNRALLRDRLEHALTRVQRGDDPVTIAFLDLDGFKSINDTWGHTHGDLVLQEVSERLSRCVREGDTVARLGGDEFVLVLEGCADEAGWRTVYARVAAALAEPLRVAATDVSLRASVGVVFAGEDLHDVDAVMRHADDAMYASKNGGKGRYTVLGAGSPRGLVDLDRVPVERG